MKLKYLLFLLFLFGIGSCVHKDKKASFFSFQNKWGVACFFEYTHPSGYQRTVFLPLENPADSSSITNMSSIFDFKYGLGMDYHDRGHSDADYKIYWISDHKKALSEKDYSDVRIFWVFAKLKYHAFGSVNEPLTGGYFHFTLVNKNDQLSVETLNFNNSVAIDTAYFKKKYVAPNIDTGKLKLKIVKSRPGSYL